MRIGTINRAVLATVAMLLAVPGHAADDEKSETLVVEAEKITDRDHPDYVKCRSEPIIGTRARKKRVCMTNSQWAAAAAEGNEVARRMVTDAASGGMNGSN